MIPRSLAGRLHFALGLSLTILIGAAWWLGHEALHRTAEAYVLHRLQHDAEALLGMIADAPSEVRDGGMPIYRQPFSGHYFELQLADGRIIRSRSLWDAELEVEPLPPGRVMRQRIPGPAGQELLTRSAGYEVRGQRLTLVVAEDMVPIEAVLRGFERLFAVLAIIGLLLTILVARWIVYRAFRALDPVYRDIDALEQGRASALTEDVPAEILPLVKKLNGLLSVYAKRLERSRNAAGNLAHALKGPLMLMLQQLERPNDPLQGSSREICRQQVERVRELAERELKRARLAGGAAAGSVFVPAEELPVLRNLLLRMYSGKPLTLDCRMDGIGALAADREDMLELFGTLLDNACKWAATQVRCALTRTAAGIRIQVEDDGPGCSEQELRDLGERGIRHDEGIAGHGLGLSIAREIAELYGGALDLGRSDSLAGFMAIVDLPIREASAPRS